MFGKSTFAVSFSKNIEKTDNKVLLIDFDLEENHIKTILKQKKQIQYNENIENLIINVNKNFDLLCGLNIFFKNKEEISYFNIKEMFDKLKDIYDLIVIDTSAKLENIYTKKIFYNCDKILFLLEPNILGIKKSKEMLEYFENDWKISSEKINLIMNKTNIYQISDEIIQELFPDNELIGKIKYRDEYNLMINKNIIKNEIKKDYEKIYKKYMTINN